MRIRPTDSNGSLAATRDHLSESTGQVSTDHSKSLCKLRVSHVSFNAPSPEDVHTVREIRTHIFLR